MQGNALFVAGVAGARCSSLTPAGLLPRLDADGRSPQDVTRRRHPGEPRISRRISYSQRTKTSERDDAFQDPLHPRAAPVPPPRCPLTSEGAPGLGGRAPPRAALSLRAALKHEICPQPQPRPVCRHRPPASPIGCASAAAAAPRRAGRAGARRLAARGGRAAPGGRSAAAAAAGDGRGGDERPRLQVTRAGQQ